MFQIFWNGEEVPGLTVYVYVSNSHTVVPFPESIWPSTSEVKRTRLFGDNWLVWVWDIKIAAWPAAWIDAVRGTLEFLVDNGGDIAWCGLEGMFADPPELLSPTAMEGGVYAAFSKKTGFTCHTDIDSDFKPLTSEEMLELHKLVRQRS